MSESDELESEDISQDSFAEDQSDDDTAESQNTDQEQSDSDTDKLFSSSESDNSDSDESEDEQKRDVELADDQVEYDFEPNWKLIHLYFTKDVYSLVQHHIYSYNNAVTVTIPGIVEKKDGHTFYDKVIGNFRIQHTLYGSNFGYKPDTIDGDPNNLVYPIDAIDGHKNYATNALANFLHIRKTINLVTKKETIEQIGKIEPDIHADKPPVMIGSCLCATVLKPQYDNPRHDKYDSGGYFISGGSEKSISSVETNPLRRPTVIAKKSQSNPSYIASIQSRPIHQSLGKIQTFKILLSKKDNSISLLLPNYFKDNTSVFVLLRALGLDTDQKIVGSILNLCKTDQDEQKLSTSLKIIMEASSNERFTIEEAQEHLVNLMKNKTFNSSDTTDPKIVAQEKLVYFFKILDEYILPHESDPRRSIEENRLYKAVAIAQLIRKLLIHNLRLKLGVEMNTSANYKDDRDSIFNKVFELSGDFVAAQFSHNWVKFLKDCYDVVDAMEKDPEKGGKKAMTTNVVNYVFGKLQHEQSWRQAMNNKGNIGVLKKGTSVVQSLTSVNISHWLSYQRKILILGIDANNKSVDIRMPQNTAYGTECVTETPEGAQTGLTRNYAISCNITLNDPDQIDILKEILFDDFDVSSASKVSDVKKRVAPLTKKKPVAGASKVKKTSKVESESEEDEITSDSEESSEEESEPNLSNRRVLSISDLGDVVQLYSPIYDRVFINGQLQGVTSDVVRLKKELVTMRKNCIISYFSSLVIDHETREFHISTEGGRPTRPLFRVSANNELKFKPSMLQGCSTWNEFLIKHPGVVEYIDKREETNILLASSPYILDANRKIQKYLYPKSAEEITRVNSVNKYDKIYYVYTHCEIHPSLILGAISMSNPFIDTNQGPRVCYSFVQIKQAQAAPQRSNYDVRIDNGYINYHPQYPLCTTRLGRYGKLNIFPSGENTTIGFLPKERNQEDNLICNESSIGRSLFFREVTKKYYEQPRKNAEASQISQFRRPNPDKTVNKKKGNIDKLNNDGFVTPGTKIVNSDCIMGIVIPVSITAAGSSANAMNGKTEKDNSVVYVGNSDAYVTKNIRSTNPDGQITGKVRVSIPRIPTIGDKFNSRFAQKSTMGEKVNWFDMLFTESGLQADFLINPGCIPRRMTMGQLIECVVAKVCAVKGIYSTTCPFTGSVNVTYYLKEMIKLGMEPRAKETFYNGTTGERFKTKIFIGIIYYQALKQMTFDKVHARGKGIVQALTKQPTEGRINYGGLKFGEMERDVMLAYGCSQILKQLLLDYSDGYTCFICGICGDIGSRIKYQPETNNPKYECPKCENKTRIDKCRIPYGMKLAIQELRAIGIWLKLRCKKSIRVFDLV